jgi:predicted Rossmann fold nucleotide-binding protein DprA/Smf involved in DNA uptake
VTSAMSVGCHQLIREHGVVLVTSAPDLLQRL